MNEDEDQPSPHPPDAARVSPDAPPVLPVPPPIAPPIVPHEQWLAPIALNVPDEARCAVCGYMLRGLAPEGRCPECGTPVLRSIQGNLLKFSAPEYLKSLHRGLVLVLFAIVAQILLVVLQIAVPITSMIILGVGARGAGGPTSPGAAFAAPIMFAMAALQFAQVGVSVVNIIGWWLFSAPDPAIIGTNTGATARQVVRVTLIVEFIFTLLHTPASLPSAAAGSPELVILLAIAGFLAIIASIVHFFAAMLYIRWLAPRLPDPRVASRAQLLMWLGPLLYTVGWLICIGPLIALVLYWNMLNWVRMHIKAIRAQAAGLAS